jgi:Na+/H+ antiporter NhaA
MQAGLKFTASRLCAASDFTMSLFIGGLAFTDEDRGRGRDRRIAVDCIGLAGLANTGALQIPQKCTAKKR